jgi:hypothetical protein
MKNNCQNHFATADDVAVIMLLSVLYVRYE